jgi:hypothetical protein
LFVARMADHSQATVFETIQAWAPLLDNTQEQLLPLILALYFHWLGGPSQAAQELQANRKDRDPLDEECMAIFEEELRAFEHIVGTARLDALFRAERLVVNDPRHGRVSPSNMDLPTGCATSLHFTAKCRNFIYIQPVLLPWVPQWVLTQQ